MPGTVLRYREESHHGAGGPVACLDQLRRAAEPHNENGHAPVHPPDERPFSKKVENLAHAVSLHFMHYNFCRMHQSLTVTREDGRRIKQTPAMAAGLADHARSVCELVGLLDRPRSNGPSTVPVGPGGPRRPGADVGVPASRAGGTGCRGCRLRAPGPGPRRPLRSPAPLPLRHGAAVPAVDARHDRAPREPRRPTRP